MTQSEQIAALRGEVAELRKQMADVAVALAHAVASQPVQYIPYVAPQPNPWPYISGGPVITCTSSDGKSSAELAHAMTWNARGSL